MHIDDHRAAQRTIESAEWEKDVRRTDDLHDTEASRDESSKRVCADHEAATEILYEMSRDAGRDCRARVMPALDLTHSVSEHVARVARRDDQHSITCALQSSRDLLDSGVVGEADVLDDDQHALRARRTVRWR